MKSMVFAQRTGKEILRDPLSYIFCLAFPIVMLCIMTFVDMSIPKETGITLFKIQNLAPGIAVFGLTFVMLFSSIQVSKDRSTPLMLRMYASPLKAADYVAGYVAPMVIIGFFQSIFTFTTSYIIGQITGFHFSIEHIFICILVLIPAILLYVSLGIFIGTLLNDKSAPGICSLVITASCILGGIWIDVDSVGGVFAKVCHVLPFYSGVKAARCAIIGEYNNMLSSLLLVLIYSVIIFILSALVLNHKMQKDLR